MSAMPRTRTAVSSGVSGVRCALTGAVLAAVQGSPGLETAWRLQ